MNFIMKSYIVENVSVHIDKLVPGGQAIATLEDGKKAFFWNALPDEIITSYEVTKSKSSYLEATALTIKTPSPHRIPPKDPCYLSTSPWQIMDYDYELAQKSTLIRECFNQARNAFSKYAFNHQLDNSTLTDNNQFHYRNKMEYSLYWDKTTEKISLAFHRRGTHQKLPIEKSSLERPEIFARATEIVADLNSRHVEARKYQFLMLRCDQQGTVSGGLFENNRPHPTFPPLTDTILDHEYTYSPNGFFQINLPVYELALKEIARHIHTKKVLDLYAGVGTIGLSVARDRDLTLVEINKSAYIELCANVSRVDTRVYPLGRRERSDHNGKQGSKEPHDDERDTVCREGNILAKLAKAEDILSLITGHETVILDPPRAGCHPDLITKLLDATPPTIVYLSCNPITQARDTSILATKYRITTMQTYNFFPRTPHIENLIILDKI